MEDIHEKLRDLSKIHCAEWQSRPLDRVYPIVFLDAIHFKVRKDNRIISKAAYSVLGINLDGIMYRWWIMIIKTVYQLNVTLEEIRPPIWRRILVPPGITFLKLHKIIQAAFGWQDYHLFNFDFGNVIVYLPDPDYAPGELYGVKELNARRTKIDDLLNERNKCIYTYDFGDNWRHEVRLEKILPAEEGHHYPMCMGCARHRPPEDVGGVGGYEEFLKMVSNPSHPEHNDYLLWAEKDASGRKFDPEYFYINEVNRKLAKIN